jgi:hypothetical protein
MARLATVIGRLRAASEIAIDLAQFRASPTGDVTQNPLIRPAQMTLVAATVSA